ncbi:uncharacterized protein LACBIDRAFT_335234 [Laccaria bicolor S238N-H82]|uniref:Predicted protein n=1 Tax=Laccaria bicolor (strain S238N-H82 / ATCC MYA-4686) TaxID=486041 RepID=B0E1S2_LACBS|nr:uncharacterized protein LACBIDRAFT_335234 [Laccaria bicolor S238N-H82]EDQ99222.1 predicted protein [Laccaria bicolor S238N-H82]|eukprot:XP_001890119.1 predicted protein [Laccaria bicolor S238N-H82]
MLRHEEEVQHWLGGHASTSGAIIRLCGVISGFVTAPTLILPSSSPFNHITIANYIAAIKLRLHAHAQSLVNGDAQSSPLDHIPIANCTRIRSSVYFYVRFLYCPIMVNQPKTNSQPRQIHPFFSKVASSGSSSAATSGLPSGTSQISPVSIDLMATASPAAPLNSFISAESLSTLHAEFASIPDLVTGTTPIVESILDLENENDIEDDDSDDSSSGDNISGNTTSKENASDSSLSGDSGNISIQFLKTVLANLKAEIETINKPKIYSDGTFWHRPRDPVFALAMSNQEGNLNPRELYHLDVFVWILGLKNRLPGEPTQILCPTALCSGKLVRHGYNTKPIARRVRGLHRDYFLLTNRLRCEDCKKSFQATDPKILEQLSRGLKESFPAFLTSRAAIDKSLICKINGDANSRGIF